VFTQQSSQPKLSRGAVVVFHDPQHKSSIRYISKKIREF